MVFLCKKRAHKPQVPLASARVIMGKGGRAPTTIFLCAILFASLYWHIGVAYGAPRRKLPVPARGAYIGLQIDATAQTGIVSNKRLGVRHALLGEFFPFPHVLTDSTENKKFHAFLKSCANAKAAPLITLETWNGLRSYSRSQIKSFARMLRGFPFPILVRWNHEMNGSWYPWGQDPALYIKKFRKFSTVVKQIVPQVGFVWAPNQGWGYPWEGQPFSASTSEPALRILDTNKDGKLSSEDDPYTPYYPGNKFVDWVGMSFYHWGAGTSDEPDDVPGKGKFAAGIGFYGGVVNFHEQIGRRFKKPILIAETASYFDVNAKNHTASEEEIKTAWLEQVYNVTDTSAPTLARNFPLIKGILWFERVKFESEGNSVIDWTLEDNPTVISRYREITNIPYFLKSPLRK